MEKDIQTKLTVAGKPSHGTLKEVVDEYITNIPGFTPQCSTTTDSNSSEYNNFMREASQLDDAMLLEPCFHGLTIDPDLMAEIRKLKLPLKHTYFLHEVIRHNASLIKEAFMDGNKKVDAIIITRLTTFGQMGEFLSLSKEEQSKRPDMKEYCEPWKGLLRALGRNGNVIRTECVKDLRFDDGTIMYPEGTIIGTIARKPFPYVLDPSDYCELLDADNYGAPHDVLDFVNEKLHEAYPQFNLWCVADYLDFLFIFDLDKLPHMKRY